jgi:type I restriction enzyme S subunit
VIEWQRVVSDLEADGVLLVQDGNHGEYRPRPAEFGDTGTAFIRAADMRGGRLLFKSAQKINEFARERVRKGIGAPCDVILSHKGTVGKVAFAPAISPPFVCSPQTTFWRSLNHEVIDPLYLYAFLQSEPFKAQLRARENESDMAAYVSLTEQRRLSVTVPPLEIQRAISGVLGALDDKIALNERLANTIEALLRDMYLAHGTAGDEIRIGDIGQLVRESVKPDSLSGNEPYIGLEHMPRKQVWLSSWGNSLEIESTKSAFRSGDILFGKLRPYFHKVGMAQVNGVCSTDIIVVRAIETKYRSWLLMALSSDEVVAHATARSDGTRMPRARWSDLADFKVPWSGARQVACFEESAAPLIERAEHGAGESRALARLRDTLLPQLMSGKLRVRDAEKIVEDAV